MLLQLGVFNALLLQLPLCQPRLHVVRIDEGPVQGKAILLGFSLP